MAADTELDPFSKVYNALWDLVEQSARLKSLVRVGNRIKSNRQTRTPQYKQEISDGDLPELQLLATQMVGKIRATSNGSSALMTLEWWMSTGDVNLINPTSLLPVMWALYAALTPWPSTAPQLITWRGKTPIKRVDLLTANSGLADPERNRGIRGWSCVWACEVELYFATDDVITSATMVVQNTQS